MKDRVSTKILNNGATRYGVYDETGALLRYEYIKLEDEPSTEGDFFNKANMLPDHIPALLGLKMGNPQVKDALNVLANVGNLHVWERVQTYAEPVPAWSELVDETADRSDVSVETIKNALINLGDEKTASAYISYSSSITVNDSGVVTLNDSNITGVTTNISTKIKGKYIKLFYKNGYGPVNLDQNKTYYVPDDASVTLNASNTGWVLCDKLKRVDGHPTIPVGTTTDYLTSTDRNAYTEGTVDGTTITYLGQLGEHGARIEVGSYVGTGTYGESNANEIKLSFKPELVIIQTASGAGNRPGVLFMRESLGFVIGGAGSPSINGEIGGGSVGGNVLFYDDGTVRWYGKGKYHQFNDSKKTYYYCAFG